MSSLAYLPIEPITLPANFCPSNEQERLNKFAESRVVLSNSGFSVVLTGDSTPAASDRDKLWHKDGDDRTYRWNSSLSCWAAKHPYAAGSPVRMWFEGTEDELKTFDGGEDATVGLAAGPMWEVDTNYAGRSPMGVGSIPGTSPAKSIALSENKGEGDHTMTISELVAHTHNISLDGGGNDGSGKIHTAADDNAVNPEITSSETGSTTPFNVTHPVRGGYMIKRTIRTHYRGN